MINERPMENNPEKIRLRCHFSSIFESLWQFWAVIAITLFNQIDTIIEVVRDVKSSGIRQALAEGGIWGLALILSLTGAVLLFQFLRWRKTWVTLDGNLIIIERNTLNRIHNTIAVENLSERCFYALCLTAVILKSDNLDRLARYLCFNDDIADTALSAACGRNGVIVKKSQSLDVIPVCITVIFAHKLIAAADEEKESSALVCPDDALSAFQQVSGDVLLFKISAASDVNKVICRKIGHFRVDGILVDNTFYPSHPASVTDYLHVSAVTVQVEHIRIHMKYFYRFHSCLPPCFAIYRFKAALVG